MKGIERRAQRVLASSRMDTIDAFDYAICAVGTQWGPNPDLAEVAFHCLHGYGVLYINAKLWRRGGKRLGGMIRWAVRAHHKHHGLDLSREHWMVVAL